MHDTLSGEDHMGLIALADGLEYIQFATRTAPGAARPEVLSPEVCARVFDLAETLARLAGIFAGKAEYDDSEVHLLVSQTPKVMSALREATRREGRSY